MARPDVGTARVIRADSRHLPLADASADLVVTSPPYFGLRSYQDGGEHYAGQVGDEATPREFIDALLEVTAECVRVLKPSGSIFVNLGDKYSGAQSQNIGGQSRAGDSAKVWAQTNPKNTGIPAKSLMLIPERYRIACTDELGLIARAVIVWDKPNGLPESVTDRVRRSHEDWVHLTVQPRYYSAVDNIREEHKPGQSPAALSFNREGRETAPGQSCAPHRTGRQDQGLNPLGKLPGSVWTIATQPLKVPAHLGVDHFAAFPMEWPRRLIRGFSPAGVCTACGEGRRPISDATRQNAGGTVTGAAFGPAGRHGTADGERHTFQTTRIITGERCACPETTAPTTPGVVLDPFGGTGTTALVAKALGRHGISVDMSADYCRLAEWRTTDPGELARAMQVDKPPVEAAGQLGMFEETA